MSANWHLPAPTQGHCSEQNQELPQLHLKGHGHPAGVATCSQLLCGAADSPAMRWHMSAIPTAKRHEDTIKILQMSSWKYLRYQVFSASQIETGHLLRPAGKAVTFWGLGLGTATEGHHGKELMRGKKQSRGCGDRGRQSHMKGKAQHRRMRHHQWDRVDGKGQRFQLAGACWLQNRNCVLRWPFSGSSKGTVTFPEQP